MASVPSAGCLLAKNQYYRTRQNSESSVSSSSSYCSDAVNATDQDKAFHGLPELIDKCWWIKSFFHSEPSPPTVGRKTLSASRMEETDKKPVILMDSDIFQAEEQP
ncbi:pancreatic progenitor cell differentiation and proliferation factor-like protein [Morus bassanus]